MRVTASSNRDVRPFVSLDEIAIRLYDRVLFERTSWQIFSDQHWAVVGPNGSGKSSLMRAVCGRLPVVAGRVVYHFSENGASGDPAGPHTLPQHHIAYVSFDSQRTTWGSHNPFHQARWNSGTSPDTLLVSEYLSERHVRGINPYQVTGAQSRSAAFSAHRDEVVGLLGIGSLLGRRMILLSNGERRKVSIARALLKRPRLLILDNPLTGLDDSSRINLGCILEKLMQGDMRVILVTTSWDEILPGITHVLVVRDGAVVAHGPRKAILDQGNASDGAGSATAVRSPLSVAEHRCAENLEMSRRVLLHMDGVSVSYDGVPVLSQITWTVQAGENWALLGPNGSGKTTLLSLVLGDNPQAYANNVTLFGRRRGSGESIWEIKRRIGWVAPELHLYYPRGTSCFDVVCSGFFDSVGLYHRGSARQAQVARSWMQSLGVSQYASLPFHRVSEGEQRLMLIARALVKHPLLLVLDEPCQALDPHNQDQVLRVIDRIGSHLNTSMIYVTHRAAELPETITHVMRLSEGRVVSSGRIGARALSPIH